MCGVSHRGPPAAPPRATLARTRGRPHAPRNAPERGQAAAHAHRRAPGEPGPAGTATHRHRGTRGHLGCHSMACHTGVAPNAESPLLHGVCVQHVAHLPSVSCDCHTCHTPTW